MNQDWARGFEFDGFSFSLYSLHMAFTLLYFEAAGDVIRGQATRSLCFLAERIVSNKQAK